MSFIDRFKVVDKQNNQINPTSEDTLTWIRRALKFLESLGSVDNAGRQRVTIDSVTTGLTLTTVTTVGTVSTITGGTITTITNAVPVGNVATLVGLDQRQFMDQSRINYNTGIRANLKWS